jgi:predicted AlkP superfamily phosphohydrolase/phosphomutase
MSGASDAPLMGDRRVVVIGLDGATFDYIQPLVDTGALPNLASLLREGAHAGMRSTYPPMSAAAWVTFMTGENPGRHGIYEFWSTDLLRYNPLAGERLVSSSSYAGKTVFDVVGRRGRVAALRVPVTFPAWEVPGLMLSGYPSAWGGEGTVWPPSRRDLLRRPKAGKSGWLTRYRGSHEDMHLDMFREQLKMVTDLAQGALDEGDYSLFMVVFNQLDAVGHHFPRHTDPAYPAYDAEHSPRYAGVITEFHERLDRAIGEILGHVKDDPLVIVMSDHGMGPRATRLFHVNAWLAGLGLLETRKRGTAWRAKLSRLLNLVNENLPIRQELRRLFPRWLKDRTTTMIFNVGSIAWRETRAYRVRMLAPIEGIEINLKGRQPEGVVTPGAEYESLRDQILEKLGDLRDPDTGERLMVQACRREELYEGPHVERAPDIVFELKAGFEGGSGLSPPAIGPIPVSFLKMRSGNHTMTGVFIARGPFVRRGVQLREVQLADVTPTILYYLGLPIPENMDGRVITEIFEQEFVVRRALERSPALSTSGAPGDDLSPEDQEAIRKQLRGLGYL